MAKGLLAIPGRYAAGIILAIMLLTLAVSSAKSIPEKIRIETVDIVGTRVQSAIYMMSSVERGRAELRLGGRYGIEVQQSKVYINYSSGALALKPLGREGQSRINPPVDFRYETGKDDYLCLIKKPRSQVRLKLGEC
ncbi:MAG: hypothetical protein ABEK16_03670 [Candidatus Nanohalobium sp.]